MNATATTAKPSDRTVGYDFDPAPKRAGSCSSKARSAGPTISSSSSCSSSGEASRTSCWTTKAKIADALGVTTKTVQRSYRHLSLAQLISLHEVSPPGCSDPNEPANRTGWRIHFLFVNAVRSNAPGPDRRTPEARRKHASKPGGENTNVLPPPGHQCPPPPRTPMSSPPQDTNVLQVGKPSGLSLEGFKQDNNNQDAHAPMSSLSLASLPKDPETPPIAEVSEILLAPEITPPCASIHGKVVPPASAIRAPELVEADIDRALLVTTQALLIALSAGFKVSPNWSPETAHGAILDFMRRTQLSALVGSQRHR